VAAGVLDGARLEADVGESGGTPEAAGRIIALFLFTIAYLCVDCFDVGVDGASRKG
jgi:hypothetical protein